MPVWKITPTWKKSIVERQYWNKGDDSITYEIGWRWGEFFVRTEGDEPPVINEDTDLLCSEDFELVDWSTNDGCWEDNEFLGFSEEEQEEIKEAYYNGGAGWLYDDPDHAWQEEDCYVIVLPPYSVEFCEEDGTVIREVKTRSLEECISLREQLGNEWCVPVDAGIEPYKWKE